MALTSPKMGLRVWDQLSDPYDHSQLADNWAKVDFHDHTPGRGVQVPTEGIVDGAITSAKLATTIDPTPVYNMLKHVANGVGPIPAAFAAGNYVMNTNSAALAAVNNTGALLATGAFYVDPGDWSAPGRTTTFRIRATFWAGNQAPGTTISVSVAPVTAYVASGSAPYVSTVGASLGTVAFATPLANTTTTSVGADFTLSAGVYCFILNNSGSVGGSSYNVAKASLLVRQV